VYKAGFSTAQEPYEIAVKNLFDALDKVEKLLEGKEYLVADRLTEADVRLFVTIVSICFILVLNLNLIEIYAQLLDQVRRCLCWSLQMQYQDHP